MSFFSKQIDKRIAVYQRELIETHYREVENMYRQMRGWRHDYRNHIQTMKILAANDDLQGLKQYLDELDHDLNTLDLVVKTGNAMADAILNSKISLHVQRISMFMSMRTFRSSSRCPKLTCAASLAIFLIMPLKQALHFRKRSG